MHMENSKVRSTTGTDRSVRCPLGYVAFPAEVSSPTPQCINSLDRAILNEMLLSRALGTPGIRVHFEHKVAAIDFERRVMTLGDLQGKRDVQAAFDLCIGADGSYSVVRRQMQRVVR